MFLKSKELRINFFVYNVAVNIKVQFNIIVDGCWTTFLTGLTFRSMCNLTK